MQIQTRSIPTIFMIGLLLGCSPFLPLAQAVVPPPDGGYPGGNTAEGQNALLNLTTGVNNTAVGWFSLKSNTNGQLNTAVGAGTLFSAVHASRNTAIGGAALFSDTDGERNTAVGALALWSNTTGDFNTALGDSALFHNTTGGSNSAIGYQALFQNREGGANTAIGYFSLWLNTTGGGNTAIGDGALFASSGSSNTAVGAGALQHPAGDSNTALGVNAGVDISGSNNIVIGANIFGFGGSNTIVIGANVGMLGESNTIRIGNTDITDTFISGISGTTVASGAAVLVDSSGHLGTVTSSKRFKEEIRPMNKTSEAIFYLEPVTFRYKKEIDPAGTSQFGLIAEEVAAVNPDLVVRDRNGQIYAVRYDQVNAMLLNEFLKEHEKIEEQQATIADLKSTVAQQQSNFESRLAQQKRQIESLTAGLQKVSAQLEVNKTVPQLIANKP
ncbi:MAG TPA: tail fiber domain-containing protein [Candidatus Udaeobacter sp.]